VIESPKSWPSTANVGGKMSNICDKKSILVRFGGFESDTRTSKESRVREDRQNVRGIYADICLDSRWVCCGDRCSLILNQRPSIFRRLGVRSVKILHISPVVLTVILCLLVHVQITHVAAHSKISLVENPVIEESSPLIVVGCCQCILS
jgi:hypothetical protein